MELFSGRELGRVVEEGEVIFTQNSPADRCFVVLEGEVELFSQVGVGTRHMSSVNAGEIFGEVSMFLPEKLHYTNARAVRRSRIMALDQGTLIEKLHLDPTLSFRILQHMAQSHKSLYLALNRWPPAEQASGLGVGSGGESATAAPALGHLGYHDLGYQVLVVEDDPDMVELIRKWLRQDGENHGSGLPLLFCASAVDSLAAALELLGRQFYSVILLDLNLKDSSGLETFRRLHEHAPTTPIVVLSAMDDSVATLQAVEEGAEDFLLKMEMTGSKLTRAIRFSCARHNSQVLSSTGAPAKETNPVSTGSFLKWLRSRLE